MSHGSSKLIKRDNPDAERFATHVARLLSDNQCEDVMVLNLIGLSSVTDYFIIATGTSDRQMKSIAEEIKILGRLENQHCFGTSGTESCEWVIADFVDVVVHLFTQDHRSYYDLESLWGDSKQIQWENATTPGQFADIRQRAAKLKAAQNSDF